MHAGLVSLNLALLTSMDAMSPRAAMNLKLDRAPGNVWNRRSWAGGRQRMTAVRVLVGSGGALLAIEGLRRRTRAGAVMAATGWVLAGWAVTGDRPAVAAERWTRAALERLPWRRRDEVEDASADSFPASDPPPWTSTVGTGPTRSGDG